MVIVCKKNHHAIDNLNKQKKTKLDSEMKFLLADILTLAKVLFFLNFRHKWPAANTVICCPKQ